MNPFIHPEFWLSLAFIIVVGLFFFSPIRNSLHRLFEKQKNDVQNKISEAHSVYKEALQNYKEAQKLLKTKKIDTQTTLEIKQLRHEFSDKILRQTEYQKQNLQVRQSLYIQDVKNHLRQHLLDLAEDKIKNQSSKKSTEQDIQHFLKVLKENKEILRQSI